MFRKLLTTSIVASAVLLSACAVTPSADPNLIAQAQAGNADAQAMLVKFYGENNNVREMVRWSQPLAQTNSAYTAIAQATLARAYFSGEGGLPKDLVKTCDFAEKSAKKGSALGQFFLADCYYNGYGNVPKNLQEAFKWNLKAATSQSVDAAPKYTAMAQSNVGELYLKGEGVKKNKAEARKWLQKAANYAEIYQDTHIGNYVNELMKQL